MLYNISVIKITDETENYIMNARQRILALRLLEKQKKHPEFMKKLGIEIKLKTNDKEKELVK